MKNFLKLLVYIFYGFPLTLIIIILRPIILFRFQQMMSERIGHFATNTELYLCEKKFQINCPKKKHIDIFCFGKIVSNKYLANLWKKKIYIFSYFFIVPIIKCLNLIDKNKIHQIPHNTMSDKDVHNLFDNTEAFIKLSKEEIEKGYQKLKNFNISPNSKFVSVVVRDDDYLKLVFPDRDYSNHNYRDFKIETFFPCFEELTKRGYLVLRMGMAGIAPINLNNKMVIDYANSEIRSDFMDIFIGSQCKFHLRTAGYGAVPTIFRRPVLNLNEPLGELDTFCKKDLLLIKDHYCLKSHRILNLDEIFSKDLAFDVSQQKLEKADVELRENSEDIRKATIEMVNRLEGNFEINNQDKKKQDLFWNKYDDKLKYINKTTPVN